MTHTAIQGAPGYGWFVQDADKRIVSGPYTTEHQAREKIAQLDAGTTDTYWLGYRHGRRLAQHEPNVDHEPALRLEVQLLDGNRLGRAWALGELRGYRQAQTD